MRLLSRKNDDGESSAPIAVILAAGRVFNRDGKRIQDFRTAWQGACERAGVQGAWVHDLRRTAVRNLERAGVSRSVAMKLTGHKTEAVYRRYAIVAESDLREGVEKLAALHSTTDKSARHEHNLSTIRAQRAKWDDSDGEWSEAVST